MGSDTAERLRNPAETALRAGLPDPSSPNQCRERLVGDAASIQRASLHQAPKV